MDDKLLEVYEKCMKHNITISINYLLSDACIEVVGSTLIYHGPAIGYKVYKYDKWVSIDNIRESLCECVIPAIDCVFAAILNKREEEKAYE